MIYVVQLGRFPPFSARVSCPPDRHAFFFFTDGRKGRRSQPSALLLSALFLLTLVKYVATCAERGQQVDEDDEQGGCAQELYWSTSTRGASRCISFREEDVPVMSIKAGLRMGKGTLSPSFLHITFHLHRTTLTHRRSRSY